MDIKLILEKHAKWIRGEDGGECANLCDADLRNASLCGADLRNARLCGASLCNADLRNASLCGADLRDANLRGASLCGADLRDANLCGAKNTDKIAWDAYTAFYPLQCPETGSFIGYKKAADKSSCWRYVPMLSVAALHHASAGAARRKC